MAQNETCQWLITYDITDNRRLARVFKKLKSVGVPVQYSVFLVDASPARVGQLMKELEQLISAKCDDVRGYRLPVKGWKATIGSAILPEDLWLA